ncbi:MAG: ABC transporter permease [Actinomycetota bacterium]|nr:ABC transporter permease [Actinomycetota bacterium]
MSALLRMELRRLRSRRLFRWIAALAVLGFAIGAVTAFFQSGTTPSEGWFEFREMQEILESFGGAFVMIGWLVGASAIGAEWQHRTVSSLLTWEPRRTRVLAAKVIATGTFVAGLIVFLGAVLTGSLTPVAAARGTFAGVDSAWWADYAVVGGRVTLVAVMAAVLGFALAAIGKNTAAALGVGFGYFAIAEPLVRAFKPRWSEWLIGENLGLVVTGSGGFDGLGHSVAVGALVLLAYAGAAFALSLWVFRRREIG